MVENQDLSELTKEIASDYWEMLRLGVISPSAWTYLKEALVPLYSQRRRGLLPENIVQYAISTLEDVATGGKDGVRLIRHQNGQDYAALSQGLTPLGELRFGAVICPDWGHHKKGEAIVYDMGRLNGGVSATGQTLYRYAGKLAQRAEDLKREAKLQIYLPSWEVTRSPYLEVNGGISSDNALRLIEQTARQTREHFSGLINPYFSCGLSIDHPDEFHEQASLWAEGLLKLNRKAVKGVRQGRQSFHCGQLTMEGAAKELAEHQLGFATARRLSDVLIVSTSPTLARACLSSSAVPFIQLAPGYEG